MPNFVKIGVVTRKPLVDLTRNDPSVHRFYDILEPIIDKYKFDATTIFNMDETSLNMVQKPGKIIASKGKHEVGSIVSAERGTSVTCASCVSAHGYFLPPFLIFKRKRLRDDLQEGAPPGTAFAVQDKEREAIEGGTSPIDSWRPHLTYWKLERHREGRTKWHRNAFTATTLLTSDAAQMTRTVC